MIYNTDVVSWHYVPADIYQRGVQLVNKVDPVSKAQ